MEVYASVIVCTYNRSHMIRDCILCIMRQDEDRNFEVIVVDNGSSDGTWDILSSMKEEFNNLKCIIEPKKGLSNARNTGLSLAEGKYIFFTDDDVRVPTFWMSKGLDHFLKYDCDALGGAVLPDPNTCPLPVWLDERLFPCLALREDVDETYFLSENDWMPFGANMAFKKEAIKACNGFDERLGRVGSFLGIGEESKMFKSILESGGKVLFVSNMAVHHIITPDRVTKSYFRKWHFDTSYQRALSFGTKGKTISLWEIRYVVSAFFRSFRYYLYGKYDDAFIEELKIWEHVGRVRGRMANKKKVPSCEAQ